MKHSRYATVVILPPALYWRVVTAIEMWHEQGATTRRWTHKPMHLAVGIANRYGFTPVASRTV